jgi:cell division protein FtsX
MSQTIRRIAFASFGLLSGAAGALLIGWRVSLRAVQQTELQVETNALSHLSPFSNNWQVAGFIFAMLGLATAIAAVMMWRQEKTTSFAAQCHQFEI